MDLMRHKYRKYCLPQVCYLCGSAIPYAISRCSQRVHSCNAAMPPAIALHQLIKSKLQVAGNYTYPLAHNVLKGTLNVL